MLKRISRLTFIVTAALFVSVLSQTRVQAGPPSSPFDDECYCDYSIGGVYVFLRDGEYRGETHPSNYAQVLSTGGSGGYFCDTGVCWYYGANIGQTLCNNMGLSGQGEFELEYHYYYYDFFGDDGGSDDGFRLYWPIYC